MDRLTAFLRDEAAYVDLAWQLAAFGPLLVSSVRLYGSEAGRRRTRARGISYAVLASHVALSVFILARYQLRVLAAAALDDMTRGAAAAAHQTNGTASVSAPEAATTLSTTTTTTTSYPPHPWRPPPLAPTALDFVTGYVNAVASWALSRNRVPGSPRVARTTFQALSLLLALAVTLSLPAVAGAVAPFVPGGPPGAAGAAASAYWYRAMVKTHTAFFYTRLIARFSAATHMQPSYHASYDLATFSGCLLGAVDACGWAGGALLLGLVGVLNSVLQRLSKLVTPENAKEPLPRFLLLAGLVDAGTYVELQEAKKQK
ncbi:hypothetical protein SPI_03710 [Niveomyces insectorum RCEF 264]|uniref:Uncharacterized protein n=1 Tax=Niveomyces insectorum RCEF 264 TaxID=1081102 RepID=A0A167WAN2_9HYPO|nr:hypothetical protein SPI_03710 [Niveomyces insectorum RCEF 264]